MEILDFGVPTPDLVDKLKELRKYKLEFGDLDEESQAIKDKIAVLEAEVVILMENSGVSKMKVDGSTLFIKSDRYASIPKESQEIAYQWLRDHDMAMLIKEGVNNRDLMACLRELDPGELPDQNVETPIIKISTVQRIGMRK